MQPMGGVLNHLCLQSVHRFETITFISAKDIDEAFRLGQTDFNVDYAKMGKRSMSVGDVIVSLDDPFDKYYMIKGTGFQRIQPNIIKCNSSIIEERQIAHTQYRRNNT